MEEVALRVNYVRMLNIFYCIVVTLSDHIPMQLLLYILGLISGDRIFVHRVC